ncbi:TPA: hypothetical protein ACPQXX_001831 [Streptococcus mutans]|uniref:type II toxin-antitoxin system antitoxin SmuA n=1 Tax=Streptococcus mutans TaxID=1309 RepID=UPI0002B51D02|nr:hypothetical protein [Streptococcus mutans]EMB70895.1 hypothetical protein SMU36_07786 [Streptococcus mutans 4VF1]EMC33607.1 hypothetical protein SMU89_03608 [Streptococcus mutans NLML1]MCB5098769.1 hypothetical protein [Streptococcus mutans]MCY7123249.1 hypothetical protein [Streptococcus mutans]MDW5566121.1 hypothetical protein [Streptococcus mutans]
MFDLVVNLILLVIVIGGFVFLRFYADKKGKQKYDERQLLMQKKAYTNAAWVVMGFNLVLVIWGEVLAKYISLSFAGTANLFLIVGVFVCRSILNDAYFTARKNKRFLYVYAVIIAIQIFTVYQNWSQGRFGHDGHIYLTGEKAMSLLFILTFAVIFLVTAYKTIQDKREGK